MHDCDFIEVTQSRHDDMNGLYVRTDDRASTPTKNSIWKHQKEDRIIFYAGSATEWRLGTKWHQNNNYYFYKGTYCISKYFFFHMNEYVYNIRCFNRVFTMRHFTDIFVHLKKD